jgi:hypothetical protein
VNGNAVITLDAHNSITLQGVTNLTHIQFDPGHFLLV